MAERSKYDRYFRVIRLQSCIHLLQSILIRNTNQRLCHQSGEAQTHSIIHHLIPTVKATTSHRPTYFTTVSVYSDSLIGSEYSFSQPTHLAPYKLQNILYYTISVENYAINTRNTCICSHCSLIFDHCNSSKIATPSAVEPFLLFSINWKIENFAILHRFHSLLLLMARCS